MLGLVPITALDLHSNFPKPEMNDGIPAND